MRAGDLITLFKPPFEFDEQLWFTLVDFATVYSEDDVRFTFKNGLELQA